MDDNEFKVATIPEMFAALQTMIQDGSINNPCFLNKHLSRLATHIEESIWNNIDHELYSPSLVNILKDDENEEVHIALSPLAYALFLTTYSAGSRDQVPHSCLCHSRTLGGG